MKLTPSVFDAPVLNEPEIRLFANHSCCRRQNNIIFQSPASGCSTFVLLLIHPTISFVSLTRINKFAFRSVNNTIRPFPVIISRIILNSQHRAVGNKLFIIITDRNLHCMTHTLTVSFSELPLVRGRMGNRRGDNGKVA